MPAPRSCLRCDCILARDNKGKYCSPCHISETSLLGTRVRVRRGYISTASLREVIRRNLPRLYRPAPVHQRIFAPAGWTGPAQHTESGVTLLARLHAERYGGNWQAPYRRLCRILAGERAAVREDFADEICTILGEYLGEEAG